MKTKTHLKIKLKTLRAECRIILKESLRWKPDHPLRQSLDEHRKKLEADIYAGWLAYWFLKGKGPQQLLPKYWPTTWSKGLLDGISYNVENFCGGFAKNWRGAKTPIDPRDVMQRYEQWITVAQDCTSAAVCLLARQERDQKGTKRKANYKAKYWRPVPADQAKLKAELKAKWEGTKKSA